MQMCFKIQGVQNVTVQSCIFDNMKPKKKLVVKILN